MFRTSPLLNRSCLMAAPSALSWASSPINGTTFLAVGRGLCSPLLLTQRRWQTGKVRQENPYSILGVSSTATQSDIKAAYKKKALLYHPDTNKSSNASEKFKEISTAYSLVKDDKSRQEYDAYHSAGISGAPPGQGFGDGNFFGAGQPSSGDGSAKVYSWGPGGLRPMDHQEAEKMFRDMFGANGGFGGGGGGPRVVKDEYIRGADGQTYRSTTYETGGAQQANKGGQQNSAFSQGFPNMSSGGPQFQQRITSDWGGVVAMLVLGFIIYMFFSFWAFIFTHPAMFLTLGMVLILLTRRPR